MLDATRQRLFMSSIAVAMSSVLCCSASVLRAQSFHGLGIPPLPAIESAATSVSQDGSVIAGFVKSDDGRYEAFRWTSGTGMVGLGLYHSFGEVYSTAASSVSLDGSVVIGTINPGSEPFSFAFRSPIAGGIEKSENGLSGAYGVSGDGSVIVGSGFGPSLSIPILASRWTAATGAVGIGLTTTSAATGVSADGSVIVGVIGRRSVGSLSPWPVPVPGSQEAFRWTSDGGIVQLGDLAGGWFSSEATAVSADGTVVVGRGSSASGDEAFRWTAADGMVGLGLLPESSMSIALGASGDGSVVVGLTDYGSFVWTSETGLTNIQDLLHDHGVTNLDGWYLDSARGISADGHVIVGDGYNPAGEIEAWRADVSGLLPGIGARPALTEVSPTGTLFHFDQLSSGLWITVPLSAPVGSSASVGTYSFHATGGALFTSLSGLFDSMRSVAISTPNGPRLIDPNEPIDFTDEPGGGVTEFTLAYDFSSSDPDHVAGFPLKLGFSTPTADFTMQTVVPEPSSLLLALCGAAGLATCGWRKRGRFRPATRPQ